MTEEQPPKKQPGRYYVGVSKVNQKMWVRISIDDVELQLKWDDAVEDREDVIKEALAWLPKAMLSARIEREAVCALDELDADLNALLGEDDE